jgi:hypothetical protein
MTLVVYKDGVLAADSRGTVMGDIFDEHDRCAHCGEEAHIVNDTGNKITLAPADKEIKFRGSKVLAIGQAGNKMLSQRIVGMIMKGKDLEEMFANYIAFHTTHHDHRQTSSFLFCCEKENYTVHMPKKGNLVIERHELGKVIGIGANVKVAEWFSEVIPSATPSHLINLIMAKNKGIGGPVLEVDLKQAERKIQKVEIKDPTALMKEITNIFTIGIEAKVAAEKKPASRRKSAVKKE